MQRIEEGLLEEIGLLGGRATTGRFLFYRLVDKGVLAKEFRNSDGSKPERQPIKYVNEVLTDLRWSNVIPFGQIVDGGRSATSNPGYEHLIDAGREAVEESRFNPWGDTNPPQVWVEDAGTGQVLGAATYRYCVPIVPMSGQPSNGLCYDVARIMRPGTQVFYLGDWDRGGLRIQKSATERIAAIAAAWRLATKTSERDGRYNAETWMWVLNEEHAPAPMQFDVVRLAITPTQAESLAHYLTSKRYQDGMVMDVIELQALGQDLIEQMVVDALDAELERRGLPPIEDADEETERQRVETLAAIDDLG